MEIEFHSKALITSFLIPIFSGQISNYHKIFYSQISINALILSNYLMYFDLIFLLIIEIIWFIQFLIIISNTFKEWINIFFYHAKPKLYVSLVFIIITFTVQYVKRLILLCKTTHHNREFFLIQKWYSL